MKSIKKQEDDEKKERKPPKVLILQKDKEESLLIIIPPSRIHTSIAVNIEVLVISVVVAVRIIEFNKNKYLTLIEISRLFIKLMLHFQ